MAHCDAWEGKWRGNWRMEWVASTLHTTSEHGVSSITTADAHTSDASSRLNWRPCRFKWTRPFRRKTKSGFCACAIIFQLAYTARTRVHSLCPSQPSALWIREVTLTLDACNHSSTLHPPQVPMALHDLNTMWIPVREIHCSLSNSERWINPYPTAFPYGNGMVLHFYQHDQNCTQSH